MRFMKSPHVSKSRRGVQFAGRQGVRFEGPAVESYRRIFANDSNRRFL